jgi:hypothetical protein
MDMGNLSQIGETKIKSYWNRPGGKLGTIVGLGALAAIGWWVFPILTTIAWNTLNFGIALAALSVFLFIVTNKKFRLALMYMWDILMKYTFGLVFTWDPFIVAEDDIKDMKTQREKARAQAIDVNTQKENIQMKVTEKIEENKHLYAKGQTAKANGMNADVGAISDAIKGNKDYIDALTPMLQNLTRIGAFLDKFDESAGRMIERAERQLSLKKDLYQSLTKGARASSAALRFFSGDPEKKLLLQQSMDALRLDMSSKLANMKKAMSLSSDYMRSIDLDKATSETEGLALLESINPDVDFTIPEPEVVPAMAPGKVDTKFYDLLK